MQILVGEFLIEINDLYWSIVAARLQKVFRLILLIKLMFHHKQTWFWDVCCQGNVWDQTSTKIQKPSLCCFIWVNLPPVGASPPTCAPCALCWSPKYHKAVLKVRKIVTKQSERCLYWLLHLHENASHRAHPASLWRPVKQQAWIQQLYVMIKATTSTLCWLEMSPKALVQDGQQWN